MKIKLYLQLLLGMLLLMVVLTIITFYMYFHTRGGTWVTELPGDYRIIRLYGNSVAISKRSNALQIIRPPIDGYAVYGHIVVGHVGKPKAGEPSDYGYFVIDTRQHIVKKQLEKKAYLRLLHNYGISSKAALKL